MSESCAKGMDTSADPPAIQRGRTEEPQAPFGEDEPNPDVVSDVTADERGHERGWIRASAAMADVTRRPRCRAFRVLRNPGRARHARRRPEKRPRTAGFEPATSRARGGIPRLASCLATGASHPADATVGVLHRDPVGEVGAVGRRDRSSTSVASRKVSRSSHLRLWDVVGGSMWVVALAAFGRRRCGRAGDGRLGRRGAGGCRESGRQSDGHAAACGHDSSPDRWQLDV